MPNVPNNLALFYVKFYNCGNIPPSRMWTLGKHILQIQVEVFHAVAATAENGEDSRIISLY